MAGVAVACPHCGHPLQVPTPADSVVPLLVVPNTGLRIQTPVAPSEGGRAPSWAGTDVRETSSGYTKSLRAEYAKLSKTRLRYNLLSFLFGLPGVLCLFFSNALGGLVSSRSQPSADPRVDAAVGAAWFLMSAVFWIPGILLMCGGLAFAAQAKGRSGTWGIVGVLCLFGLIILAFLKHQTRAKMKALKLQLQSLGETV